MHATIRSEPRRARRILHLAVATLLCALSFGAASTGSARADGDPASDMLVAQNVFYPYRSPVPRALQHQLDAAVSTAHRARLALKVALIAHRVDLGAISPLYGRPQRYAKFLGIELSYNRKVPLLVVMSDGFGSVGLPSKLEQSVRNAHAPGRNTGAGLAVAALSLVTHLDAQLATGHAGHANTGSNSNPQTRTILLFALILAALLVGSLLIIARVFFPPTGKLRDR